MSLLQGVFYNDAINFIFDDTKIEVIGGKAQLKNRLVDSTFGANYNIDINGSWGDGVLTGTAFGGASVSGGKLDLTGGTVKYVEYSAVGNADSLQVVVGIMRE